MINQKPTATADADAAILAALIRLAIQVSDKSAVQMELGKIKHDLLDKPEYSIPFGHRIRQVKDLAGLD